MQKLACTDEVSTKVAERLLVVFTNTCRVQINKKIAVLSAFVEFCESALYKCA